MPCLKVVPSAKCTITSGIAARRGLGLHQPAQGDVHCQYGKARKDFVPDIPVSTQRRIDMPTASLTHDDVRPIIEMLLKLRAKADQPQLNHLDHAIRALNDMSPLGGQEMLARVGQRKPEPGEDFGKRIGKGGGPRS